MKSKTIANVQSKLQLKYYSHDDSENLSPKLDPVYSITENEDLYTAVKLMIETKTRRVLVMCCSDHKHVSNLITVR
jgi:predicted transcriptional regulator